MRLTEADREQRRLELITFIIAMTEYITQNQPDQTVHAAHAALAHVREIAVSLSPAARDSLDE